MPNIYEPEWEDTPGRAEREGFTARRAYVARHAGARRLGASLWEIDAGQAAYPYHYHLGEEELIVVIEGAGRLRTRSGWRDVRRGEVLSFPTGEEGGHQLVAGDEGPLRILSISTAGAPDIVIYPDSDKLGAFERLPGGKGVWELYPRADGDGLLGRRGASWERTARAGRAARPRSAGRGRPGGCAGRAGEARRPGARRRPRAGPARPSPPIRSGAAKSATLSTSPASSSPPARPAPPSTSSDVTPRCAERASASAAIGGVDALDARRGIRRALAGADAQHRPGVERPRERAAGAQAPAAVEDDARAHWRSAAARRRAASARDRRPARCRCRSRRRRSRARQPCTSLRLSGEEIQRLSPAAVAILPSSEAASLSSTNGRPCDVVDAERRLLAARPRARSRPRRRRPRCRPRAAARSPCR